MQKCIVCSSKMKMHKNIKGCLICPKCTFVCADMNISEEDIKALYRKGYFCGEEYADYVADEALHKKNFTDKLKRMNKVIGPLSGKEAFEIGCAYGFFLAEAEKCFRKARGIDISEDAVAYACSEKKVQAIAGDYLKQDLNRDTYDVICMWDTIEHLARPDLYLQKAWDELKEGGCLCITTGDIGSLNARLRGRKWRQIHPPTHLQYFSKKTLTQLLNRYSFQIADISYPGNRLSIKNIVYSILHLHLKKDKLLSMIIDKKIMNHSIYINLHDYMFVIARK